MTSLDAADVDLYLARIGFAGVRAPTAATLRALHVAHMCTVPFENLSVRRQEPIVLDERALFDKIVVRRRGGFCYELNGLFAALLESLGFRVQRLAARVGADGIDFDHMALRVDLDTGAPAARDGAPHSTTSALVDVGFGDSFLEPLSLYVTEAQSGGDGRRYRIDGVPSVGRDPASRIDADSSVLSREGENGTWQRQYAFTWQPWPLAAFADGCRHHCTSPSSHFMQNTVVSLATRTGRITLSERRLIVTENGVRTETEIAGDAAFAAALSRHFGM